MKYLVFSLLAITVAATALLSRGASPIQAQTPPAGDVIPGRYIVVFRDNALNNNVGSRLQDVLDELRTRFNLQRDGEYRSALRGFVANNVSDAILLQLRADPRVLFVEPDRIVHITDTLPTGIRRIKADQNSTADINGSGADLDVDVAVIDTGIDMNHGELRAMGGFAKYAICTANCGGSNPSLTCSQTASFQDGHGHGTHVSGTIAARDNGSSVVGVAPGARLWAVRVLGSDGWGCNSDIVVGVDQVTACKNKATGANPSAVCNMASGGVNIAAANMSIGGGNSSALCTAIQNSVNAGVTYAVAAGNSNVNAQNSSPANCSAAITVSAIADYNGQSGGGASPTCSNYGADDRLASFSNYGSVVDIAAPGVCILSTWPGGGTATLSGTSMATPHVAGAAALYKAANPSWTPAQVRSAVLGNAFPQNSACGFTGDKDTSAEPLLNLGAPCANTAPTVTSTSPANNATGVAIANNVTATFNEAMTSSTINSNTFLLKDAGNNPVGGAVSYNSTSRVATFNPTSDLAYSTTYTATITTGAQDSQGLGLASAYNWSFTTAAAPVNNPPTVSSTSPAANATGLAVSSNITATFNEAMNSGSITAAGTFTLKQGSTDIPGAVSYSGNTATFNPINNLANSTSYTATISTAAQDSTGLNMTNAYSWSFTTAAASTACVAPTITSHSDSLTSGAGSVSFAWSAVPGATQYRIERQSGWFGTWQLVTTTTSTSYSGSDSSNDPNWRIRVQQGTCTGVPGPYTTFDP